MSPATLGIDIAKKDNAEAQREKEKVTIFTRNIVMAEEGETLRRICIDLLCADEFMRKNKVTCTNYDVYVQYDEFADSSYENKMQTILAGWREGLISDETAIEYLYGKSWSEDKKRAEVKWIVKNRESNSAEAEMGEFGELGADNPYNEEHKEPEIQDL